MPTEKAKQIKLLNALDLPQSRVRTLLLSDDDDESQTSKDDDDVASKSNLNAIPIRLENHKEESLESEINVPVINVNSNEELPSQEEFDVDKLSIICFSNSICFVFFFHLFLF